MKMVRGPMVIVALLALVLAGCSGGARRTGPVLANGPQALPAAGVATVRPGDTVYSIARRYGISQRELIQLNGLQPPYLLQVGQTLRLSNQRIHVVRSGDTVSEIAETYGVDQRALISRNGLRPPYTIRVGQRLAVPSGDATVVAARPAQRVPEPPRQASRQQTRVPGQPWQSGGQLHFPSTSGDASGGTAPAQEAGAPSAGPPLPVARPGDASGGSGRPAIQIAPPPGRTAPEVPAAGPATGSATGTATPGDLTPPGRAGAFIWPIQGRVIGNFGPREGGLHNDGINIAAPAGTRIRAAENGIVVYAGNQLQGFGNLLLIKHADGFVTAYAHADKLLARRGERVERGQVIATVGQSGNVASPQLHFEIRRGPQVIDPRTELPRV